MNENKPLVYPWRKVIYSALKPGTKTQYFILTECGHVHQHGCVYEVPKKKKCSYCSWGSKKIDIIFWEHDAIRWAFVRGGDLMELMEKQRLGTRFTVKV